MPAALGPVSGAEADVLQQIYDGVGAQEVWPVGTDCQSRQRCYQALRTALAAIMPALQV
jgi:hypothetical protein